MLSLDILTSSFYMKVFMYMAERHGQAVFSNVSVLLKAHFGCLFDPPISALNELNN